MLKSCASQIFDFTPLLSASEQGTIIGIAGKAYNSATSRQGYWMQRGRGWSSRWRDRGERECAGRVVKTVEKNDNPYNIPVFLLRTNRKRLGGGWLGSCIVFGCCAA